MSIRALSFVLLSSVLPVVAQEPAAAAPKPPVVPSTAPGAAPAPKQAAKPAADDAASVTMAFAGGTLAAFCDQLRSLEFRPNIVVAPLAAEAKLPAIQLRAAGLEEALAAACAVAVSDVPIGLKGFHGAGEPVFTILATLPKAAAPAASATESPGGGAAAAPRRAPTQVYSLNTLLAGWEGVALPVETVLMALEVALDLEPAQELHKKGLVPARTATLRFHKDSGLLIVRGNPDQLALAQETLACLEADLPDLVKRRSAGQGAPSESGKAGK